LCDDERLFRFAQASDNLGGLPLEVCDRDDLLHLTLLLMMLLIMRLKSYLTTASNTGNSI
jgi:hypothetical protein